MDSPNQFSDQNLNKFNEDYFLKNDIHMLENYSKLGKEMSSSLSVGESRSARTKRSANVKWSKEEDDVLIELVSSLGCKNWKKISECMKSNKNPVQCLHRWSKILKPGLRKGPWTIEEDRKLLEWIRIEGPNKWSQCSEFILGRNGKQCRERWFNTLNPKVKKGSWTNEEDYTIFKYFSQFGSKWAKIASMLPGRTENSIKNRFYSTLRRIASENNKPSKDTKLYDECNFSVSPNTHISTNNLQELLKYFPHAMEEKTKLLSKKNRECSEDSLLNKKKSRTADVPEFKTPTGITHFTQYQPNINNTVNVNVNITNPYADERLRIDKLKTDLLKQKADNYNNLNKSNIEELENAINNFCCDNLNMNDSNFDNFETKLNNLINDNHTTNNIVNQNVNLNPFNFNNSYNNEANMNNLLNQLNDLEALLKNAKRELTNMEKPKPVHQILPPQLNLPQLGLPLHINNTDLNNYLPHNEYNSFNFNVFGAYENDSKNYQEDQSALFVEHLFKF